MRALLAVAVLLLPSALAHGGVDSGVLAPGASWTYRPTEAERLAYRVDGVPAGNVTVTGAGDGTAHHVAIRADGTVDNATLAVRVGDTVTFTNGDDASHRITGTASHVAATSSSKPSPGKPSPMPGIALVGLALVAVAWGRRA